MLLFVYLWFSSYFKTISKLQDIGPPDEMRLGILGSQSYHALWGGMVVINTHPLLILL